MAAAKIAMRGSATVCQLLPSALRRATQLDFAPTSPYRMHQCTNAPIFTTSLSTSLFTHFRCHLHVARTHY